MTQPDVILEYFPSQIRELGILVAPRVVLDPSCILHLYVNEHFKALAIWYGCEFAKSMGLHRIIVESDSKENISALAHDMSSGR
ncbi:hypothetical protein DVH24_031501 [Malus domestica]|uniref:Uncharacterized protein n=1 Tax=Malus domestica TaxID=3750 RepID=A0A498HCH7_MALDO|nr:hypothetical protein DVH24_031501 [Malus domestica]